ncbi:hypothetical protein ACFXGI_12915 [Streptomyces sp. NPDC059355]|uniref:hypothetical protein n=1 Tax=Streptomyces sp. NPDC059355 TaxID=3346811 RepID=UPI0036813D60
MERRVADLVDDGVEGAVAQGGAQPPFVVAVGDEAADAGRRGRGAAVEDGDLVARIAQEGDQVLSELPASADDENLLHGLDCAAVSSPAEPITCCTGMKEN